MTARIVLFVATILMLAMLACGGGVESDYNWMPLDPVAVVAP